MIHNSKNNTIYQNTSTALVNNTVCFFFSPKRQLAVDEIPANKKWQLFYL